MASGRRIAIIDMARHPEGRHYRTVTETIDA
jgi:hypothetical protein